ncbi:hypothetical protein LIER_17546 [Lithospermum erythrorhizon]|uniref:Reverse transcriptase domain-containing protein n=1 Tax=Lithospermum erythrorhizon TaxID=34254 RepID=A0AAV3QB02_LITER
MNGTLKGWFGSTRGLRQGDPISSYLFLLVLEVFNVIMREASATGFEFHHLCHSQRITHMSFVDDIVIVASPTKQNIQIIRDSLRLFGELTGLRLNCPKSKVYFGNVGSRLNKRICSKINSCQARQLSFGGRAQLIRSSLFGVQNFWCANLPIPKYVIQEVEKHIRTFLWSGKGDGHYHAKVAWKTLCLPLCEGGLGFKCMVTWNQVCLGKLLWNIASLMQTLWVQWVHSMSGLQERNLCRNNYGMRCKKDEASWGKWLWRSYGITQVWRMVLQRLKDYRGARVWAWERGWIERNMGGKGLGQRLKQVAFTTTVAKIWEERNRRCFGGAYASPESILQRMLNIVQSRARGGTSRSLRRIGLLV